MEYLVATFNFNCKSELIQTARDLLADAIAEAGFESFEDTDNGIKGYVQKAILDKDIFNEAINDFPMPDVEIEFTIDEAEQKDWNQTWESAGFQPIIVDNKIIIYDARNTTTKELFELDSMYPGSTEIAIEARMAFGTGTHQTTQMIVSTLLTLDLNAKSVLDCGCGTGILGIVAAKVGASRVVGYDIDEWSVENAKHNATLNGISNIQVMHGDCNVLSHTSGLFDIVMANINRNILLSDMVSFKEVMSNNGLLILSGFYEDDTQILLRKAAELGLKEIKRQVTDNWTCLVLK